jgi:hypothetical protein
MDEYLLISIFQQLDPVNSMRMSHLVRQTRKSNIRGPGVLYPHRNIPKRGNQTALYRQGTELSFHLLG